MTRAGLLIELSSVGHGSGIHFLEQFDSRTAINYNQRA
jgi:hypothetical protein